MNRKYSPKSSQSEAKDLGLAPSTSGNPKEDGGARTNDSLDYFTKRIEELEKDLKDANITNDYEWKLSAFFRLDEIKKAEEAYKKSNNYTLLHNYISLKDKEDYYILTNRNFAKAFMDIPKGSNIINHEPFLTILYNERKKRISLKDFDKFIAELKGCIELETNGKPSIRESRFYRTIKININELAEKFRVDSFKEFNRSSK